MGSCCNYEVNEKFFVFNKKLDDINVDELNLNFETLKVFKKNNQVIIEYLVPEYENNTIVREIKKRKMINLNLIMRPIVDLNNLWYSEETLVYNSRINLVLLVVIQLFISVFYIYNFDKNEIFFGVLFLVLTFFSIREIVKFSKERNVIQLRINSKGVSIRSGELISWDKIENERIEIVKVSPRHSEHDFIFYDAKNNQQVKFRVEKLTIGVQEITKSFEIHRNRFNEKNKPN